MGAGDQAVEPVSGQRHPAGARGQGRRLRETCPLAGEERKSRNLQALRIKTMANRERHPRCLCYQAL